MENYSSYIQIRELDDKVKQVLSKLELLEKKVNNIVQVLTKLEPVILYGLNSVGKKEAEESFIKANERLKNLDNISSGLED